MFFRKLTIIAKGRGAEDVARAILLNEYSNPIEEIKKHKWNSFEYCIDLELTRKFKIQGKESENDPSGGNKFMATFSFVHFLAITDKFKVLSGMNISDEEMLRPVNVTNETAPVVRKDSWIFGATALHLAAMYSPKSLAVFLFTAKNKERVMEATNLATKRGVTALHVAAMSPDPFSVQILLKNGAKQEAQDSKQYTPLFYAAKASGIEASYHLLETGQADANAQGANGKTALFKAETYKDVLLLVNYNIEKDIKMKVSEEFPEERTALHYLVDNCYEESPLALMDSDIFEEENDTFQMDLGLPLADEEKETLGLHKKLLKKSRKDLFLHPIMETFLHFKFKESGHAFNFRLITNLILCIAFSMLGTYFTKLYDCKYVDETDEKEDSLDCNHMNDHFSVAENCYYFFNHDLSWFPKFDERTYFVNKFYGCDAKSKIVKSTLTNSDGSEMYPNGTILDIQCYKNHTLRLLKDGNAHTRYGIQELLKLRGIGGYGFLLHPCAIIVYVILFMRLIKEFMDIHTLGCKAYMRLENMGQLLIILLSAVFMIMVHITVKWSAHLAGVVVVLLWIDFAMEIGRLNNKGEFIYIIVHVARKIIKFLMLYLPVISAFAFGLHFVNNSSRAYSGMFTSFLRVFVHMTGESEFSDHFQWSPVKLDGGSQTTVQVKDKLNLKILIRFFETELIFLGNVCCLYNCPDHRDCKHLDCLHN